MRRLLARIFSRVFYNYLMAEAHDLHRRVSAFVIWIVGLAILASILNLVCKEANIILSLILFLLIPILAIWPELLAAVAVLGFLTRMADLVESTIEGTVNVVRLNVAEGVREIVEGIKKPLQGSGNLLKKYVRLIQALLLYSSVFLMVLGVVPFKRNPFAIPLILAAIIGIYLMAEVWGYKVKIAKRVVYLFFVSVVIMGFASVVPAGRWFQMIGFDPAFALRNSIRADAWTAAKERLDTAEATADAREIREITDRILAGKAGQKEMARLEVLRRKAESGTLPGKVSVSWRQFWGKRDQPKPGDSRIYGPGVYYLTLDSHEETGSMLIVKGMRWDLTESSAAKYDVIPHVGEVVEYRGGVKWAEYPEQLIAFRVMAYEPVILRLVVSPRTT